MKAIVLKVLLIQCFNVLMQLDRKWKNILMCFLNVHLVHTGHI